MNRRTWAVIDWCAHVMFALHLIPAALQDRVCDRYDDAHNYH